jgi:F-type H+-transporting ATPase subunit b
MKKELQSAINKADTDISVKVDESEKSIAEIKKNAVASVEKVAKDTAKEIVSALGSKADAKTISLAVSSKIKG